MIVRLGVWFLIALQAAPATAEDWPTWLGPNGDSTWRNPNLPDKWQSGSLRPEWKIKVGGGYSGLAVANGRLITMDRPGGSNSTNKPEGSERVVGFDARTGSQLWTYEYPANYTNLDYPNGPRAMPTVDDSRVYTLGAVGQLACLEAATGTVLWANRLVQEFEARVPTWGFAGSPLVHGDAVIVHVGAKSNGCILAFDKRTGKKLWGSFDDPAGYCAPVIAKTTFDTQLIAWSPEHVFGIDPSNGQLLWKVPYKVTYGVSIAAPIVRDDIVFVAGYWEGSKAIALGPKPTDAQLLWEDTRNLRGLMSAPIYRDGFVYLLDKKLGLTCFEYKTGRKRWDDANQSTPRGQNPQATLTWLNDTDRVLILNSDGELIHARLSPQGYRELSRQKIVGETWCYPAFADGAIFARSDRENEIVRVGLEK